MLPYTYTQYADGPGLLVIIKEKRKSIPRFHPTIPVKHTGVEKKTLEQRTEKTKYEEHSASPPSSNPGICVPGNSGELCSEQLKQDMRNLEDLQREKKKKKGWMEHLNIMGTFQL